jgi:hypothetical protein
MIGFRLNGKCGVDQPRALFHADQPKPAFAVNGCGIESDAIVFDGQVQSLFPRDQFYLDVLRVRVFCNISAANGQGGKWGSRDHGFSVWEYKLVRGFQSKYWGWWYIAIGIGFLLLAIVNTMRGGSLTAIVARIVIAIGFECLAWVQFRSGR